MSRPGCDSFRRSTSLPGRRAPRVRSVQCCPALDPPCSRSRRRGSITVDQPRAFAVVTSPLTVSGTASLFEGGFSWKVVDLAGKELTKGTGQASPGAPARGTFSFTVTFTVTGDTYAYLSLVSFSAKDGSVDDEARVPIILTAR